MSKKNKQLLKQYKETPKARAERVRNEAGMFRPRVETPKTVYSRKGKSYRKEGKDYGIEIP